MTHIKGAPEVPARFTLRMGEGPSASAARPPALSSTPPTLARTALRRYLRGRTCRSAPWILGGLGALTLCRAAVGQSAADRLPAHHHAAAAIRALLLRGAGMRLLPTPGHSRKFRDKNHVIPTISHNVYYVSNGRPATIPAPHETGLRSDVCKNRRTTTVGRRYPCQHSSIPCDSRASR
jgi:hypothetical protein